MLTPTPQQAHPPALSQLNQLAAQFDAAGATDYETRIALGEQIKGLLGAQVAEFETRFEYLAEAEPAHPNPAQTVLKDMALASRPAA